jgi:hypothetical protein
MWRLARSIFWSMPSKQLVIDSSQQPLIRAVNTQMAPRPETRFCQTNPPSLLAPGVASHSVNKIRNGSDMR